MAQKLIDAVIHDGGIHFSLSLLLHQCPALHPILSGYALIKKSKEEQRELFEVVNIFSRNNEVYLQSTMLREGRMIVDETGLFSVASSKSGNAFATLMANISVSVLSQNISETIAIDLTASVGGVTFSLSRKVQEVVAIEIDPLRAELCN
jgi:tRNA/tmRNA/rRNA uracil-C5-methylase (TrmA/RlmC/RlmD family)